MIDKIELRLPASTSFRPDVTALLRHGDIPRGQHYSGVLDLRPHGLDALLHYRKRREEHAHKLELFETGKKAHSDMAALIERVVDGDSRRLELMRIDLCADVPDVPVSWFHAHARIRYKQRERRMGPLTSDVICKTSIESLTLGARPNVIRIYDKIAEETMRFKKACRRQSRDADPLDFVSEFGHAPNSVITRIERQCGGGRLPVPVRTFGNIGNAVDFNPFETIELGIGQHAVPCEADYSLGEWLTGSGMRYLAEFMGAHHFRRWLNRKSKGNSARWIKTYGPFLACPTLPVLRIEGGSNLPRINIAPDGRIVMPDFVILHLRPEAP